MSWQSNLIFIPSTFIHPLFSYLVCAFLNKMTCYESGIEILILFIHLLLVFAKKNWYDDRFSLGGQGVTEFKSLESVNEITLPF